MKKSIHRSTLALGLLALLSLASHAWAAPFTISTTVLNAETNQPQSRFQPGDHILVQVTAEIPPKAKDKKLHLALSAKASAYGFEFPVHLLGNSSITNDLSVLDPSQSGPLVQAGAEEIRFVIPKEAPTGKLTVTIKASIKTVGQTTTNTILPVFRP